MQDQKHGLVMVEARCIPYNSVLLSRTVGGMVEAQRYKVKSIRELVFHVSQKASIIR